MINVRPLTHVGMLVVVLGALCFGATIDRPPSSPAHLSRRIVNDDPSLPRTQRQRVTVGEIITFELTLTLDGTTPTGDLSIRENMPPGFAFVGADPLQLDPGLLLDNPVTPTVSGYQILWDLGAVTSADNGPPVGTIRARYRAAASNTPINQQGRRFSFSASLIENGEEVERRRGTGRIALPELLVATRFRQRSARPGENIELLVTLAHAATSRLDAWDLDLALALPSPLSDSGVAPALNVSGITATVSPGTGSLVLNIDRLPRERLESNPLEIIVSLAIAPTHEGGGLVVNGDLQWTTCPGTPPLAVPGNTTTGERGGDPLADGGAVNNLRATLRAAFEDLSRFLIGFEDRAFVPQSNDFDYNDLICQVDITETLSGSDLSQLQVRIEPVARGAASEHRVDMRLGLRGSVTIQVERFAPDGSLLASSTFERRGERVPDFTVIESSMIELPPFLGAWSFAANTSGDQVLNQRTVGGFTIVTATPADPSLNPAFVDDPRTLVVDEHIDQLVGFTLHLPYSGLAVVADGVGESATQATVSLSRFPNAPIAGLPLPQSIVMPAHAKWPLERVPLWEAFPDFVGYMTEGASSSLAWFRRPEPGLTWPFASLGAVPGTSATGFEPETAPEQLQYRVLSTSSPHVGAPTVVDVDADGQPELALSGFDTGAFLLRFGRIGRVTGALRTYMSNFLNAATHAPLMQGDFDGDGNLELMRGDEDGRFRSWTPTTGAVSTLFADSFAIKAGAAIGDVNGDGTDDIVTLTGEGRLHALSFGWLPGFPMTVTDILDDGDHFYRAPVPALAPLGGAPGLDIVVTGPDGRVQAIDGTGQMLPGFPYQAKSSILASPAVGTLRPGDSPVVVAIALDGRVHVIETDGQPRRGWPQRLPFGGGLASPVLVDLDGDDIREIVVVNRRGAIHALRWNGETLPGFPVVLPRELTDSPAVADLDGDGRPELALVCRDGRLHVIDGDGSFLALAGGRVPAQMPLGTTCVAAPVIADIDGDGRFDIIVGGYDGSVWLFPTGSMSRGTTGWPSARGSSRNDGTH